MRRFALRRGTPGQTARAIATEYTKLGREHPNASHGGLLNTILEARHAVRPYLESTLGILRAWILRDATVAEFATSVAAIEAHFDPMEHVQNPGDEYGRLRAVVREEVRKLGLK